MEKRILLDTSVYGMLAEDDNVFTILMEKKKEVEIVFYGCTVIRNELRATPKEIREINKNLRIHLLYLYDSLIIKNDFFIVALATIYQMDIVVSNDKRTLLSPAATEAYKCVNKEQGFRNPAYLHYNLFKRKIITGSDI